MTANIEVPGIGIFRAEPNGQLVSKPQPIAAFRSHECQFALDGFDGDQHPEDFIQAMRNVLTAGNNLLGDATPYVHMYCVETLAICGDQAPTLRIATSADVWQYVDLGAELAVSRDHGGGRDVFVSLECSCAWEIEHGLQLVFRNGREISKVGPFDGHVSNESAYSDARLRDVIYKHIRV